jgi:hypothetical protein
VTATEELKMKRKTNVDPRSRRGFLKDLAATGGAVAVATVAGQAVAAPAPESSAQPERSEGYRVTEHVKTYYDKARI